MFLSWWLTSRYALFYNQGVMFYFYKKRLEWNYKGRIINKRNISIRIWLHFIIKRWYPNYQKPRKNLENYQINLAYIRKLWIII